jgi:hypothetical protein
MMTGIQPISMKDVSEKVALFRQGRLEEDAQFVENPKLTSEEFVPLEDRMAKEKPEIAACLASLKAKVGGEIFAKRFSTLQNINRSGKNLLIVSGSERLRTLLLKENLKDIMEAFSVDNVRIVGGAGFGGIDAI